MSVNRINAALQFAVLFAAVLISVFFFTSGTKVNLTGYVPAVLVGNEGQVYAEQLNLPVAQSSVILWTPANLCTVENCSLSLVKIAGEINAGNSGEVSIFLSANGKSYALFNKVITLDKTTALSEAPDKDNTSLTYTNVTENNVEVEVPQIFYFNEECGDLCDPSIFANSSSYNLTFVLGENISLVVYTVTYTSKQVQQANNENISIKIEILNKTIDEVVGKALNKTADETLNETENKIENKTSELTNSTLNFTEGELYWESGAVSFNGENSYYEFPLSSEVVFLDNYVKIDAQVKVSEDSQGVIVSKYDYLNGKFFELSASPGGFLTFSVSSPPYSVDLSTKQSFSDGAYHNVSVLLNRSSVLLYVDSVLQDSDLEAEISDINSESSISISANLGMLPWTGEVVDVFNGFVKQVKVHYRQGV
ncbi:MAG: laminin G domain-containing protein [Candidatus Micrarchaeota archaeon]|nr:laminin G domain-containing protein [Candidatus Micrarchaeota archaeon]